MRTTSQTCHVDLNLPSILTERGEGEKNNDLRDSAGNRSESGTQDSDHHDKNKASYKGSG